MNRNVAAALVTLAVVLTSCAAEYRVAGEKQWHRFPESEISGRGMMTMNLRGSYKIDLNENGWKVRRAEDNQYIDWTKLIVQISEGNSAQVMERDQSGLVYTWPDLVLPFSVVAEGDFLVVYNGEGILLISATRVRYSCEEIR